VELAGFYNRVGSDTIDFRFRFLAESPSLLSVALTVSAECDTSLSAYFRLLSVDLYVCVCDCILYVCLCMFRDLAFTSLTHTVSPCTTLQPDILSNSSITVDYCNALGTLGTLLWCLFVCPSVTHAAHGSISSAFHSFARLLKLFHNKSVVDNE